MTEHSIQSAIMSYLEKALPASYRAFAIPTSGTMLSPAMSKTIGWSASCNCGADPVKDVVLDPFGGAGTTGLVADRLQRNAILIELNPEYVGIARRRIQSDAPLLSGVAL